MFINGQLAQWPAILHQGSHLPIPNSVRALWEEHRYVHILAQERRAAADAIVNEHLPIPEFILFCAEALAPEARTKVALCRPMHGTV